ncbi:Bug family tripartite tricarboxylate transporter substrate binding protein [Humitalea sp. 24SJ18S-53]|uniref:Bug family tripartite tricarboxylate transporter substrate binding protein n=1 Tax=Humitalea sp. 24SJ18S-53 TaxID=3422307 RepID=UPI003D674707
MLRRHLLAAPALLLGAGAAQAQGAFPTRPIRFVVPWPAGGATSNIARIVGDAMTPLLGQPVIFDNRSGAGGSLGAENVAKSPADGYTILMAGAGAFYRPLIDRDTPFNPDRDFGFVGLIGDGPFALAVRPGLPSDLPGFIAYAKANPGKLNMVSSGIGSTSHLAGEMFNRTAGIEVTHVPYRGSSQAMVDLVAGRVDFYFDALSAVVEHYNAQRLNLIGLTTTARVPQMPQLATIAELGVGTSLANFSAAPWWGVCSPANMPAPVLEKLSSALGAALAQPAVVQGVGEQGCTVGFLPPVPFAAFVRAENTKWSAVIEAAGLRVT